MTSIPPSSFFIGWDVGGWNCDKNPNSRDAIVILDAALIQRREGGIIWHTQGSGKSLTMVWLAKWIPAPREGAGGGPAGGER